MEHIEKTDYRINRPIFRHFKNGYKALKLIEATLLSVCHSDAEASPVRNSVLRPDVVAT
jgi:hypothetical protein